MKRVRSDGDGDDDHNKKARVDDDKQQKQEQKRMIYCVAQPHRPDQHPYEQTFMVYGLPKVALNSIRIGMMVHTPTMSIDDMKMLSNTSSMRDPMLGLQVGLVPLHSSTVHQYLYPHECNCGSWCRKCGVKFRLHVENTHAKKLRRVTTQDLIPEDESCPVIPALTDMESNDEGDSITIVTLAPGEEVIFEGIARKGTGKLHAKWGAATPIGIKSPPIITLRPEFLAELTKEQRVKIAKHACTDGSIKYDEEKDTFALGDDPMLHSYDKHFLRLLRGMNQPDAIEVKETLNTFRLEIGTTGSVTPKELLISSLQQIHLRLTMIQRAKPHIIIRIQKK
jgi:DNA-directed RNA polymerase alpha subunit